MRMRGSIAAMSLAGNLLVGVLGASEAFGQTGAVVVIPGKPGMPVLMNGRDISWAVVEGDWGLARAPGQVQPTVIYRYGPPTPIGPADSGYYPATGRKPRVGRLEIIPPANRRLPTPAEDFHRSWGVTSDMTVPATMSPNYEIPGVTYAPTNIYNNRYRRPDPGPRPRPRPR